MISINKSELLLSKLRNISDKKTLNFKKVILKLKWDTDFFGFNIATINHSYLNKNVWNYCYNFILDHKIKLVYFLCNSNDRKSIQYAEKYGFSFVDNRLTFQLDLNNHKDEVYREFKNSLFLAKKKDKYSLIKISKNLYKVSRYYFDIKFDKIKVDEFYQNWLEKSIYGLLDDECLYLSKKKEPMAFITIKYKKNKEASIGLIGVSNQFQGLGYGKHIIDCTIQYLKYKKIKKINVVTQGRNLAAQNLFTSCKFKATKSEIWYHKWL